VVSASSSSGIQAFLSTHILVLQLLALQDPLHHWGLGQSVVLVAASFGPVLAMVRGLLCHSEFGYFNPKV